VLYKTSSRILLGGGDLLVGGWVGTTIRTFERMIFKKKVYAFTGKMTILF
jgi:hypothetical protein